MLPRLFVFILEKPSTSNVLSNKKKRATDLRKPQKSSFINGRAIKRGGEAGPLRGEGGKAGPLRKKNSFWNSFFLFICYLKIKDILLKATYQNINTGNVGKVVVF